MKLLSLFVVAATLSAALAVPYIEEQVMKDIALKGRATVILHFKGARTAEILEQFKEHKASGKAVTHNVLPNMLMENAQKNQMETLALLKGRALSKTSGGAFHQLWALNQLVVHGADHALISELKNSNEVTMIEANREFKLLDDLELKSESTTEAAHMLETTTTDAPHILQSRQSNSKPQWGVAKVGAPEVWAKGFLGQGVTVGIIDTGVRRTHRAFADRYRAEKGWFDAVTPPPLLPFLPDLRSTTPIDDQGHGTHCTGSILGGNGLGVAPNATWIACKALNAAGSGSSASLRSCGQFMLCPHGPRGRKEGEECGVPPKVISNSWGSESSSDFYDDIIDLWVGQEQMPIFANGNAGDKCPSTGSPADNSKAISVGATTIQNGTATFSSRGPTQKGLMKPDVSAPGKDIVSSDYRSDTATSTKSGTSMAAPHVAGVAALYLSNDRTLTYTQVFQYLRQGARPLVATNQRCGNTTDDGKTYPNNINGYGEVYAPNAFE